MKEFPNYLNYLGNPSLFVDIVNPNEGTWNRVILEDTAYQRILGLPDDSDDDLGMEVEIGEKKFKFDLASEEGKVTRRVKD
jgi:hypothetical protein